MKHLSVRDIPRDLAEALGEEKERSGLSLSETVKQLLRRALGLGDQAAVDNGLAPAAGSLSEEDLTEFEANATDFEVLDDERWG